ncbi:MAG: PH domain-containing protein [Erythrobacter sp.]|nr:MAG: PH domain-containing protein [Erythrobacter sp.]
MSHPVSDSADEIEIGEWRRVSPLSIAAQGVRSLASAAIPLGFVLFGASSQSSELATIAAYAVPILLVVVALNLVPPWLGWVRLRYRVGESDVRLEQGIISRSARSVPYDRIQDVSLEQKLIPRLLGLVEVRFETGAGGKDELKLAYVSEAEGERLREVVRALVEGAEGDVAAPADGEPVEAVPEGRLLFAMGQGRLFTYGLFSFSLVVFAVLLGAAQQFEFLLPFDLWEYVGSWFEDARYAEAGSYIDSFDTGARVLAVLYLLASVIVVGLASGVVKTFVRDWGFRLDRTAKGFRRRRGLLTKTDVVMPAHRVQALVLSTGILRRRFGWYGLSFISLAQDSGSANHEVAPFARLAEVAPIAQEAGFSLPDESEQWRRPSPNYYFDRAMIACLVVTVLGIIGLTAAAASTEGFVPGLAVIGAVILGIVGVIAAREFYLWRYDRHALDPAQVLSRRGWLAPRTQVANRVKLHSVEIAQGPLARWRGYCDLRFGLAGGSMAFNGLALEDARKLRSAVLESIASVDFARLPK